MENYISLIIPVYSSEKYLPLLFECIQKQDYPFFEVIFVNDGSTDNSLSLLEGFCKSSSNKYRYINKENRGPNSARKAGIDKSRYGWIMFADSDDYFGNKYISNFASKIEEKVDIICAPILMEDKNHIFITKLGMNGVDEENWDTRTALLKLVRNLEVTNHMYSKLFRKKTLLGVDYSFNQPFEDYITTTQSFYNANIIKMISDSCYHYVKRDDSLSKWTKDSLLSSIDAMLIRRGIILDLSSSDFELLQVADMSLLDRFIQTIEKYLIKRSDKYYGIIKKIYKENKKTKKYGKFFTHNLPLYFISPSIYYFSKKMVRLIRH